MGKQNISKLFKTSLKSFEYFQGGYKINFNHSDLEYDESLFNLEVQTKQIEGRTVVNVRAEQFEDINDQIIVHFAHYERVNNEYQHLLNASINSCNVMSRLKSHPLLRIILKELLKASNIPTSCPIKKGIYYMKDFSLNEDLLPPFLPMGHFMCRARMTRLVDGNEITMLKVTVNTDIEYEKDRKSFKMF